MGQPTVGGVTITVDTTVMSQIGPHGERSGDVALMFLVSRLNIII